MKNSKSELSSKKLQTSFTIGTKRGRPTILWEKLDQKFRAMIVNLRTAGAVINTHVVSGVLAGIVRSNLEKYGQFSDFEVTIRDLGQTRFYLHILPILYIHIWNFRALNNYIPITLGTQILKNRRDFNTIIRNIERL